MEERLLEIFKKSSYHQLSSEEKEFISELCANEEDFENVKHLYSGMESLADESFQMNSDTVKNQLDAEFKEVHSADSGFRILKFLFPPIAPIYAKPGMQIAFLLLFIVTIYVAINRMPINDEKAVLYSQNTEQEDLKRSEEKAETRENKTEQNDDKLTEANTLIPELSIPEDLTESAEIISNDFMIAEVDESIEDVLLMDEMVSPEMAPTTAMAIAGVEGEIDNDELFFIEPIGDNLELLDDLFVTF
ncbi:MAG: hypothetical protein DBW72_04225 [Flavobacteriales bacterium]|nr:MAG: hypothetical protein DBW72_04225 [Flavobacteriales bacterium]